MLAFSLHDLALGLGFALALQCSDVMAYRQYRPSFVGAALFLLSVWLVFFTPGADASASGGARLTFNFIGALLGFALVVVLKRGAKLELRFPLSRV